MDMPRFRRPYPNELWHAQQFKYIDKEWKNGRWEYTYPEDLQKGDRRPGIVWLSKARSEAQEQSAHGVIDQMRKNSEAWKSADETTRKALADQNVELAKKYESLTGKKTTRDENGVWKMDSGGAGLYEDNVVSRMRKNSEAWKDAGADKQKALADENAALAKDYEALTGKRLSRDENGEWRLEGKDEKLYEQSVLQKMRYNSSTWKGADAGRRKALEAENQKLAREFEKLTGKRLTRGGDGVWYVGNEGGARLYGGSGENGGSTVRSVSTVGGGRSVDARRVVSRTIQQDQERGRKRTEQMRRATASLGEDYLIRML